MNDEASLLARLPAAAQSEVRLAIAAPENESYPHVQAAFAAVGFPKPSDPGARVYPLASNLDYAQRALAELSCAHPINVWPYALPPTIPSRKRWLGIEPPSALEATLVKGEPLWRSLQLAGNVEGQATILDALPNLVALDALAQLLLEHDMGYAVSATEILIHADLRLLRELEGEAGAWAVSMADRVPPDNGPHRSMLAMLVFVALARAGVPIEPRGERLFPNLLGVTDEILIECARALSSERRTAVLVTEIKRSLSMNAVLQILAEVPSAEIVTALLAQQEVNSRRWSSLVRELRKLGKKNATIAGALEAALAGEPPPIELVIASSLRPRSAADLSDVEREQVRIAGKNYDGFDLSAERRLTTMDRNDEQSFEGSLEVRHIADASGQVRFDMLLYMIDGGAIFRAGTTESIGGICQGGVELLSKDLPLRTALQRVADARTARRKPPRPKANAKKRPKAPANKRAKKKSAKKKR
jgi:hypothetical protein